MNNKISNPLLKEIISNIASKANEGRVVDINWKKLYESKNMVKLEAAPQPKEEDPLAAALTGADKGGQNAAQGQQAQAGGAQAPAPDAAGAAPAGGEADPLGGGDDGSGAAPADGAADAGGEEGASEEDAEKAQADATKAKADLEKAKAEKDQAEKELEKQSYIKLKSSSGVQFMLSKLLNQAFKTNTIDALASEMVQKLNIKSPEDVDAFALDNAQSKVIPGMANLIASMKVMATKEKSPNEEEPEQTDSEGSDTESNKL